MKRQELICDDSVTSVTKGQGFESQTRLTNISQTAAWIRIDDHLMLRVILHLAPAKCSTLGLKKKKDLIYILQRFSSIKRRKFLSKLNFPSCPARRDVIGCVFNSYVVYSGNDFTKRAATRCANETGRPHPEL